MRSLTLTVLFTLCFVGSSVEARPASLSKAAIQRVIRQAIPQFQACYEDRLEQRPDLAGRVVIRWTIGTDGYVRDAAIRSSTLGDEPAESCLVDVTRTLEFSRPPADVVVNYPFVFSPD